MILLSVLKYFPAVAFLALTASGGKVIFDLDSSGKYWHGGPWDHHPNGGHTNDCICIKGVRADTNTPDAWCFKGINYYTGTTWLRAVNWVVKDFPELDGSDVIEITTYGTDALWIDRLKIETSTGSRWYGNNDTKGYCLSMDPNEKFDKYATHEVCAQTLTFLPHGYVAADWLTAAPWNPLNQKWLLNLADSQCKALNAGRRRVEGEPQGEPEALADDVSVVGSEVFFDADPAGTSPTQVHNEVDALVVGRLHREIRQMVREKSEVTDEQIDSILNSAMLDVEHLLERKEHEGEVLEPAEVPDGYVETGSNSSNMEPSKNVPNRLRDLEASP